MNKKQLKKVLRDRPGYLKSGSPKLAKLFQIPQRYALEAVQEVNMELEHPITPFKRLIFDIETSPNIGWFWQAHWKTNIGPHQIREERRVICVSYKWENEAKVHNLSWDENKQDATMLEAFTKILLQADEVITHNGDRFDIPWLRTRCVILGLPFPTYIKSLDTLKKVKSMFNFQRNTLNYIAKVIGLGGKIPIQGSVWEEVVFTPSKYPEYKAAMTTMVEYCDYDVVLLEDVFHKILSYIKPVSHVGRAKGKERHSCPNCGSEDMTYLKHTVTASGIIKRHIQCEPCGSDYIIPNQVFLKMTK